MVTTLAAPARTEVSLTPLRLWHLLSLDAPSVAAVWVCFLAYQLHATLPLRAPLALALAVWILYVGDRISDAQRGQSIEERHRFHFEHRTALLTAAAFAAPALLLLVTELRPALRLGWLALAAPLGCYALAVHIAKVKAVPKEIVVACFFATATMLPAALYGHGGSTMVCAALSFGIVCWLNCATIARWEGTLSQADPLTAGLGRHLHAGAVLVVATSTPLLWHTAGLPIAFAAMLAAGGLLLLDRLRASLHQTTLRALADAALLTPLLVWPLFALSRLL